MTARQERMNPESGCDSLNNDSAVQKTADRRLRADPGYAGPNRRGSEPSFSGVVERVEKTATKAVAIWSAGVVLGGLLFAGANVWFESDAEAQEAHAALGVRIDGLAQDRDEMKADIKSVRSGMDRIIALQLKQERRALQEEIAKAPPGQARTLLQTQLDRVEEELGEK